MNSSIPTMITRKVDFRRTIESLFEQVRRRRRRGGGERGTSPYAIRDVACAIVGRRLNKLDGKNGENDGFDSSPLLCLSSSRMSKLSRTKNREKRDRKREIERDLRLVVRLRFARLTSTEYKFCSRGHFHSRGASSPSGTKQGVL